MKWTKKTVLFLLNCAIFNAFNLYIEFNGNTIKYKKFLHSVARSWIEEDLNTQNGSNDSDSPTRALVLTPRTPKFDHT